MSIFNAVSDQDSVNDLVEKINRCVQLKHEQDTLKEDVKTIAEDMKEKYGIKPAAFNKVVRAAYKNDVAERRREIDGIEADLEVLESQ